MRGMAQEEAFDLNRFAGNLADLGPERRERMVTEELDRVRALTIRDAAKRFLQQMYVTRLERLGKALRGEDVANELTPSERQAHTLLFAPAVAAAPAPAAAAATGVATGVARAPERSPEPSGPEPSGKDRRVSRRIQMRTRARVRREADNVSEVLEPTNVSRGGIGFQSTKRFALNEIIFVIMHYQPGAEEMETRSMIVRASALRGSTEFSYGVKFL